MKYREHNTTYLTENLTNDPAKEGWIKGLSKIFEFNIAGSNWATSGKDIAKVCNLKHFVNAKSNIVNYKNKFIKARTY